MKIRTIYICTIIGARPQYIKSAMLTQAIEKHNKNNPEKIIEQIVIHTGQHYDYEMHGSFFDQMKVPMPDVDLGISGGGHGNMVGRMMIALEKEIEMFWLPVDYILVFGDTNSTLAGALVASKLQIPLIHVEAGLRCFNKRVPEEVNRVVTDHLSDMLFCYSNTAELNLMGEGITKGVYDVGDISYDAFLQYSNQAKILRELPDKYCLITIHRAENISKNKLIEILDGIFEGSFLPGIIPIHPNTKMKLNSMGIRDTPYFKFIDPVPYFEMLALEKGAEIIITDSGGVQKEAFWYGVPCITLREETEEIDTVGFGGNVLVGANSNKIIDALQNINLFSIAEGTLNDIYGNGTVAEKIIERICE